MTALEILVDARDWLAVGPERWCQGAFARDAAGKECRSERAVSACVWGALSNACREGCGSFADAMIAVRKRAIEWLRRSGLVVSGYGKRGIAVLEAIAERLRREDDVMERKTPGGPDVPVR